MSVIKQQTAAFTQGAPLHLEAPITVQTANKVSLMRQIRNRAGDKNLTLTIGGIISEIGRSRHQVNSGSLARSNLTNTSIGKLDPCIVKRFSDKKTASKEYSTLKTLKNLLLPVPQLLGVVHQKQKQNHLIITQNAGITLTEYFKLIISEQPIAKRMELATTWFNKLKPLIMEFHAKGYAIIDFKPDNICINSDEQLTLVDTDSVELIEASRSTILDNKGFTEQYAVGNWTTGAELDLEALAISIIEQFSLMESTELQEIFEENPIRTMNTVIGLKDDCDIDSITEKFGDNALITKLAKSFILP